MPLSPEEYRIMEHLAQYLTDQRKATIEHVLARRTRFITVALEDIYQSHNASAVVRTCECLGIQDIHIIENTTPYQLNKKVLKGSYKWVNLIRYKSREKDNSRACMDHLKSLGYRIVATDPEGNYTLEDIPVETQRLALFFGNEDKGVSETVLRNCDMTLRIPMTGFTESLNISVSVGICLYRLMVRVWQREDYGLTTDEKDELRLSWYRKIVRNAPLIEKRFLQTLR
jgi:tRNA (guanosine-2'-O-)-methyltransferase